MPAGRAIRIARGTSPGEVAIVGSTQDNFEITREGINITDKDDLGVQTFDETTVGTWAMTGTVEGVLKDTTILALLDATADMTDDFVIDVAGLGTYAGKFALTGFSVNGADGAEPATFTFNIASSGTITRT